MTFLALFNTLPLTVPFLAENLGLMCGKICGGKTLRGHGHISGPRGPAMGGNGALPGGKSGSGPPGWATPPSLGGGGNLCLIGPRIALIGGSGILGGIPGGGSLAPNLGGGGSRIPAGGSLGPKRGPLFKGLMLPLQYNIIAHSLI